MAENAAMNRMGEPEEAHGHTVALPHHAINYFGIFYLLIVLTVVTVGIAFFRFNNELFNVALALLVAFVKATFVARYFMHLKFEGKLIYLILLAPLVLCVIMVIALIPDIGWARTVAVNDMIHWFEMTFAGAKSE